MDNRQFDALVKTVTSGGTRRGLLRTLGAGTLAAIVGRLGTEHAAEARKKKKKKKKKCKNATKLCGQQCIPQGNCCLDADCGNQEACINGVCSGKIVAVGCQSNADCRFDEFCQNGNCLPDPVPDPVPICQDNGDCGSGEACFAGTCVLIQGTCAATDDHCAVVEALCNPSPNNECFCAQRFGGGAACIQEFVPGAVCGGCVNDAECDAVDPGSVCVSPVENGCPCDPGQGICARLCDNQ
jgi:hypothetical protein